MAKIILWVLLGFYSLSSEASSIRATVVEEAVRIGAPPPLLLAICTVESSLNPYATNFGDGDGTNSHGLCQIKYATAQWMRCGITRKELYVARLNARCAAKYIKYQLKRYDYVWDYAIAAYNAGSVIKNRRHKIVNQTYVDKVWAVYRRSNPVKVVSTSLHQSRH